MMKMNSVNTTKNKKEFKKWQEYLITIIGVMVLYYLISFLIKTEKINGYQETVLIFIGVNIIAAASLNLATGFLGQLALGHAGFMAIGAYTAGIFSKYLHSSFPELNKLVILILALSLGGLVTGIMGMLIGIPALRLRGDYLGIVTLGFGEIIRIAIFNMGPITGGAKGFRGIPKLIGFTEMYFLVVIVLTVLFLLIRSRHGRAMISIKEDEIAAESVGIPTTFYKIFGFSVSAFFAGVAGSALAFKMTMIDPKKYTFMFSVEIFVVVVLGGMGSLTGTVIAAVLLGILNEALHFIDNYRLVLYSLLLIIMMIFRPDGLFGSKEFSLVGLVKRLIGWNKKDHSTKSPDLQNKEVE